MLDLDATAAPARPKTNVEHSAIALRNDMRLLGLDPLEGIGQIGDVAPSTLMSLVDGLFDRRDPGLKANLGITDSHKRIGVQASEGIPCSSDRKSLRVLRRHTPISIPDHGVSFESGDAYRGSGIEFDAPNGVVYRAERGRMARQHDFVEWEKALSAAGIRARR